LNSLKIFIMKKIKFITLYLSIIFLLIPMSCSDDWLKPDPLSFFAPENVFIDEAGFESGLIRVRKDLMAEFHGNRNFISNEHGYSDLAASLFQVDFRKVTPSYSFAYPILSFFENSYTYIKNTNTIISRIDGIEWENQDVRNRILAEALWFRSYWYYRLVTTYGDIPWVGEELRGPKLDYYSTSYWAILEQIQGDLEYASQWLPVARAKLNSPSKGAADHLLTKVYLARGEFDKAIASANRVINGPYALMKQRFGVVASNPYRNLLWDLHRPENKNNPANTEVILTTVERPDAPPGTWWTSNFGTGSMRLYAPSYWKVMDETGGRATNWNLPGSDTLGIGNADVRTIDYFHYRIWEDDTYKWNTTPDLRRVTTNWIEMGDSISDIITARPGSPQLGEPLNRKYYGSLADTMDTWYPWPHYKIYVPTPNFVQPRGGESDWYVFRLAETYLLRAEAYFWKGDLGPAADDINEVRARANAPLISAAAVTLDYIFDERARELYTEEPRHSEMIRVSFILGKLNRDGYSLQSLHEKNWYHDRVMRVNDHYIPPVTVFYANTATILPNHFLWPIPQSVITANTKGVINQNIGYDGDHLRVPPLETIP
jgi:starch-binding outer membrane protein, SusD/RagB family